LVRRFVTKLSNVKLNINRVMCSRVDSCLRRMFKGHVARMGNIKKLYILIGKDKGKMPLGRPICRWQDNNEMVLKELRCSGLSGLVFLRVLRFSPVSIIPPSFSISYIIWMMNNMSVSGSSSETSHPVIQSTVYKRLDWSTELMWTLRWTSGSIYGVLFLDQMSDY
jgi:hypothetical protein